MRAPGLPTRAHAGVAFEQVDDAHDEVVEIDGLIRGQCLAVVGIRARSDDLVVVHRSFKRGRGRNQRILPRADLPLRRARAAAIRRRDQFGDDGFQVRRIEDREAGSQSRGLRLDAQDLESQCMERGDDHLRGLAGLALRLEQRLRALAHFARRLVGERDRDDPGRVDAALDQVCDLGGDDARLAAARAGQHEQGSVEVAHGLALRGIEGKLHEA